MSDAIEATGADVPHARPARAEIGVGLQSDKRPGRYAELARIAENSAIDVVTVFSDLLYQPSIGPLLEIAHATERVRVGCAGWNPFTLHPYEIAGQFAALDAASHGRAYLGLVKGSWLDAIGLEPERPVRQLGDAVAFIRALLSGSGDGFAGEHFSLEPGTRLRYPLERTVPDILLGSWGPLGAALAGRVADEIKIGGSANPAMVGVTLDRVAVGLRQADRAPGSVGVVMGAVTVVDRDGDLARTVARREVAMYLDVIADLDPTVTLPEGLLDAVRVRLADGDRDGAGRLVPRDVLDLFAFAGDPDDVAERAQTVIDAGASRVEFGTPHGVDEVEGMSLLASAVVPHVRR